MCEAKSTGYPSIDKPWLKYYSTEAIHTKPAECTVYQNIYQHNQAHPHDLALEYFGVKITFSKLFAQVESCAKALLHAGVHLGDRVTLCTSGTPEAVYVVLACSKIGAVANFINPMFQPEQIRDRINETEASLLFVLDKLHPNITSILSETCIQQVIVLPATNSLPAPMRFLASLKEAPDAALNHELKSNAKIHSVWDAVYCPDGSILPKRSAGRYGVFFGYDRCFQRHRFDQRWNQRNDCAVRDWFS